MTPRQRNEGLTALSEALARLALAFPPSAGPSYGACRLSIVIAYETVENMRKGRQNGGLPSVKRSLDVVRDSFLTDVDFRNAFRYADLLLTALLESEWQA